MPHKMYRKYTYKDGTKIYIPILQAKGYVSRLSRMLFTKAQGAQDHALKFRKRFIRMKEFVDGQKSVH